RRELTTKAQSTQRATKEEVLLCVPSWPWCLCGESSIAMKITSINVNGLRSAARKGFFDWLAREAPDVVCVQELKAQQHQLQEPIFRPEGYHGFFHCAARPGYSGVAIYSRR